MSFEVKLEYFLIIILIYALTRIIEIWFRMYRHYKGLKVVNNK